MAENNIPQLFDTTQVNLLMRSRRSIYTDQFVPGKTIPDETIMQLLENANWAPTHKNTEPWRFIVFKGKGLKRLADYQAGLYKKEAGEKFKQAKYEKLGTAPLQCSHVIAIGMKRSAENMLPEIEEIAAVSCAVENIALSATAYGLGGYWSTGGITYIPGAKSFFGLMESDKLLGFYFLGHVQTAPVKGYRKPIAEKVVWIND